MPGRKLKASEAEAFWKCADENNDGELTVVELRHAVAKYSRAQGKPEPDEATVKCMFTGIAKSDALKITKSEFFKEMAEKESRDEAFCKMFKQLDKDGNGTLSREEVRELFRMTPACTYSDKEIDRIIDDCDKDHNGVIDFVEFQDKC